MKTLRSINFRPEFFIEGHTVGHVCGVEIEREIDKGRIQLGAKRKKHPHERESMNIVRGTRKRDAVCNAALLISLTASIVLCAPRKIVAVIAIKISHLKRKLLKLMEDVFVVVPVAVRLLLSKYSRWIISKVRRQEKKWDTNRDLVESLFTDNFARKSFLPDFVFSA